MIDQGQEKKRIAIALCLALALILTTNMTLAYLSDVSGQIDNEFNPEWVFTDVAESGDKQYDIVPGTEETKDPKVKVNNSVDAYVYLIVTDKINANGQVVDYTIDPMWTEISNLPETIYDGEGNPITLTEYDKVYYTVAPKTAPGETEEVKGEDNDDYELVYPVLVGDKVSYPSSLTNSDLAGITNENNTLSFKSYAIQKDPFESELDALDPIPAAKRIAKKAIDEALGENPTTEMQKAAKAAKEAIDEAETLDAIDEAKNDGLEAIAEAATHEETMPEAGDKVKLGNSDKIFVVTEVDGSEVEVIEQAQTGRQYDADYTRVRFDDLKSYIAYAGSDIDNFLENTYYSNLPADVREKILPQTITQSAYESSTKRVSQITVGERHVYLLDMDYVKGFTKDQRVAIFPHDKCWLRSASSAVYGDVWRVDGKDGTLYISDCAKEELIVCAAFKINLDGLHFEVL